MSTPYVEKKIQCTHRLVKLERLVHLAGEAVDEEPPAAGTPPRGGGSVARSDGSAHGSVEKLDGDLHRDDRALPNACADELPIGGALTRLLCAEEVARGQVAEVELFHETAALRALSGAGAAEDEDDGDLGWVHGVSELRRRFVTRWNEGMVCLSGLLRGRVGLLATLDDDEEGCE